jgi:hypothetical protein
MFEHKRQPLVSRHRFYHRIARSFIATLVIIVVSLAFGTQGYHFCGNLSWMDSLYNATMILTGMGHVDKPGSASGKLFAVFYSLYCGFALLSMVGVIAAPIAHRFMHRFHLETGSES